MATNSKMNRFKRYKGLTRSSHNVIGLVHPFRPEFQVKGRVPKGTTVYDAIFQACEAAKINKRLLRYGIAQIGKRDYEKQVTHWEFIPFSEWTKHKLGENELLRFRILPQAGGGGGGKNILGTVLMVVVAIAAVVASAFTFGALGGVVGAAFSATQATAMVGAGLAGMAVLTLGQALVNAIAPVSAPSTGSITDSGSSAKESDIYSISGGRNSINQWGRVPVPCGRGRYAPPKGAAPYTQLSGDDQYLHELFCLGIGDMSISAIKIGSTPIEDYNECNYEIMTYDPANPKKPKYYPTGIYEETLNVQLKKGIRNIRTTNLCDYAEIDLSFQGLCWLNDEGKPMSTSVDFDIQYKKDDGTDWTEVGDKKFYNGKSNYKPTTQGTYLVGVNLNTGIFFRKDATDIGDNEVQLGKLVYSKQSREYEYCHSGGSWDDGHIAEVCTKVTDTFHKYTFTKNIKTKGVSYDGFEVTVANGKTTTQEFTRYDDYGVSVASGNIYKSGTGTTGVTSYRVTGAQTRLLRKTYRIDFPERGVYAVAITRRSNDSNDDRLRNDAYWTALRSMTDDLPVKTKYPVMLLSLQVKATGQLNGSLENLTVYYETKCWDYNPASGSWDWQYTSNPAAIYRYILQQKDAFSRPQPNSALDLNSIKDAYVYYSIFPYKYDKVMDQSVSIFERLVSIGAACLSSPTMLEGKWGIIIDRPRDNVICAFTSANAWQWSFERQQIRLPNAIHCNFINEDTWDTDMRVVDTDESTTGDYLYETQEYDGVIDPRQVFQLARFHYADAKMRRRTISFRCYDEAILCTRGDLVELACPNINVAGLQVGRIRKINKNNSGAVISVTTDQINTTDFSGRTFGVRIYSNKGDIYHAKVKAENKSQRLLTFVTAQTMDIQPGNKYAFGDFSEEVFQAIVLSMKFNTDWTCDITCQDYTPQIYGDLSKPIPEWYSIITKAIEFKWELTSVPKIVRIVSDETAIVKGSDGTLQCRMLVYVSDPKNIDSRAAFYQAEIREVQDDTDPDNVVYSAWYSAARGVPIEQSQFYINEVNEGTKYQVRVRYSGVAGEVGSWTKVVEHTIIGKTTIPPDVKNFKATIDNPNGIKLTWDMIEILDIAGYRISGAISHTALASPYIAQIYKTTGTISFGIVAVDAGGRTSKNTSRASVVVYAPKDPVIQSAQLLNPGIVIKWADAKTTWDIASYLMTSGNLSGTSSLLEGILPFAGKFPIGQYCQLQAKDIFDNWSENQSSKMITIYPPQTPVIKVGINKVNGNVTLDWQDCKNQSLEDTPDIDHYEVTGTLANNGVVSVKGVHYESIVPLIVYEMGTGTVEGGIPVHVGNLYIKVSAVDKYGIRSEDSPNYKDNQVNLAIYPPYNPTDFGISATVTTGDKLLAKWTEATAIMLTWRDCERVFAIDYYLVYDYYTQTSYKVSTNYIVLPARPQGQYHLTVQAVDVLGLESANMDYYMEIIGVGGMEVKARVDGADILLEWGTPSASFQIDHYIIFEDNDDLPSGDNSDQNRPGYLGQAKVNYFRIPAKKIGSFTYYVWAVDVAGNINTDFANYATIVIVANPAPTVSAAIKNNGVELGWEIKNKPANSLPVATWEVHRYPKLANASQIPNYTPIEDYGQIAASKINVDAFEVGNYSFAVRSIDTGGNYGAWGLVDFTVKAPGQVQFVNAVVIDNNVQIYWSEPNYIFFPIKEYIFAEVDKETGIHMLIGSVDAQFASETEEVSGEYTYSITPVDWGGNRGASNSITLRVSQPPDFVFYDNKDSLFNGTKTNLILDGIGHMLGPVPVSETWQQNITRATQVAGTTITTHQDKINAGFKTWLEPPASSGTYVEVIDHGAIVPSTNYKVTISWVPLSGNPRITCKVELSEDGKTWRLASDNALTLYVTQFRYSRITLTITGGYVQINNINIRLDVKKLADFGRAECKATDNGAGWISESATPMLTGTWIPFKVNFVDVQSLPKPNVINNENYTAFTVFEDVLNPKGFRIFVKDKNGNRVTATVEWTALGV